jgi:hypothetical protein
MRMLAASCVEVQLHKKKYKSLMIDKDGGVEKGYGLIKIKTMG